MLGRIASLNAAAAAAALLYEVQRQRGFVHRPQRAEPSVP
jgi:tRNA(Leu) C34 or U34 (ribose-2'-O)-methylase TrmL